MTDDDQRPDGDLRARLRNADPAAGLPPVSPARITHLSEHAMTATATPRDTASPGDTATPRTSRRRLVPALAVVLGLAAAGLGWAAFRPERSVEVGPVVAQPSATTPTSATTSASAVDLTMPGGVLAKCAEPKPEHLTQDTDFVFAGTVSGIDGRTVTLAITHVYKGAPAGLARVGQAGGSSETMMGSGRFETGKDYLVASSGGDVLICGYSGEADSPGLRELYEAAF
ncbi:hypothetical protein AB0M02_23890 [Actinoplanes sp. NPDC051861]|uniref:hypothetical protein n=1 Tax=Actinoplanes sp. NPDC051861 TaxID=3155170 RepID=UPI0034403E0F